MSIGVTQRVEKQGDGIGQVGGTTDARVIESIGEWGLQQAANEPRLVEPELGPELPRTHFDGTPDNVSAFGSNAGVVTGHNPVQVAIVVLGGAAAAITGTAGVALSQTLDTDLDPTNAANGAGLGTTTAVGHDTTAPVDLSRSVLFGQPAGAVSALSDHIRAGGVLELGARGAEVLELQHRLTAIGITVQANGEYDAATVAAVEQFQQLYRVQVNGKFGATSLDRLEQGERVTDPDRRGVGEVYAGGVRTGELDLVYIDGKPVSVETANALRPMIVVAANERNPVYIHVVSGHRTLDEQRELYRDYRAHRGPIAARPGHSNHQNGRALDLNSRDPGVYAWLKKNAGDFGFMRTVRSERWHWEYLPQLARQ